MTTPDVLSALRHLVSATPEMLFGIGTVTTAEQAAAAACAGAQFLVSPGSTPELIAAMRNTGCATIGGFLTPSELMKVRDAGADALKLFPASSVDPAYLTSLRGPFPDVPIIPTGGINIRSARAWLDAGALAVGMGGVLTRSIAEATDAEMLSATARTLMHALHA